MSQSSQRPVNGVAADRQPAQKPTNDYVPAVLYQPADGGTGIDSSLLSGTPQVTRLGWYVTPFLMPTDPGTAGYTLTTDGIDQLFWVPLPSGVAWGAITGTLSAQTDLQTALNAKADTSSLGSAAYTSSSAYEVPLTFSSGLNRSTNTITVPSGGITNAMLAGPIPDSLLDTISTVGKVSNSATTADIAATPDTIALRTGFGVIVATGFNGALVGNASTASALQTTRAIYGNNFDGSAALTQIIASTYGGTGNGFAKFTGPATTEKTFTLPNASATILTDNAVVTGAQGGTGVNNSGKTITLGGNFTTSGAFAGTFTFTGTTTVTFPTTGTLSTLALASSGTPSDLASTASRGSTGTASDAGHVHKAPGITSAEATLGADFTLTSSGAYNDTGLSVTLPDIGKYLLSLDMSYTTQGGCGTMYLNWYDSTTGSIVADNYIYDLTNTTQAHRTAHCERMITTTASNRVIKIRIYQSSTTTPFCKLLGTTEGSRLRYVLLGKT